MSERTEKYRAKYLASIQEHVADPVREIAIFSRPRSIEMVLLMQVSPASAMGVEDRSSGLPRNCLFALTDSSIVVYEFRPRGTNIRIKDQAAHWSREGLRILRMGAGPLSSRVGFQWSNGAYLEMDTNIGSGGFNEPFLAALEASAPPA